MPPLLGSGLGIGLAGVDRSWERRAQIAPPTPAIATTKAITPAPMRWLRCLRFRRRWNVSRVNGRSSTRSISCSIRPRYSDIGCLPGFTQRCPGLMREGPYRRGLDAQKAARLLPRVPEGLGQDQCGTLPGRERGERVHGKAAILHLLEDVTFWAQPHGPLEGGRRAPVLAPEEVHRCAVEISGRNFHGGDDLPPLEQLGECILREVLGFGATAGDHAEDPQKPVLLGFEERLEGQRLACHRVTRSLPPSLDPRHGSHFEGSTFDEAGTCRAVACRSVARPKMAFW